MFEYVFVMFKTFSFHVHVSLLHGLWYYLYLYHLVHLTLQYTGHYISCIHLLHLTLLFHVHVPMIHEYAIPLDTVISYICIPSTQILCTQLFYVLKTLHSFTCLYALIVSVFLLYGSLFLLHGYSRISVTGINMTLLLLDMSVVDIRCVKLSVMRILATRTTSRIPHLLFVTSIIPHLLFLISRYLISWYQ